MKYVCKIGLLVMLIAVPSYGQDGIRTTPNEYYGTSKPVNYPFLAGRNTMMPLRHSLGSQTVMHESGSCCAPLLPTVAQGIRDTFSALFPCRGMRRLPGQGLLFSVRFYESGCCGSSSVPSGIILESGGEPTPAQPAPVPEEIEPEIIDGSTQFHRLPKNHSKTDIIHNTSRIIPISGASVIPSDTVIESLKNSEYPVNPLRR
ncbi:MAG: hypothetical protein CMJ76_11330 [Planctomycetaceae bacterium]|nr:hypothetical protein [Planctomycetaceae bacterium]